MPPELENVQTDLTLDFRPWMYIYLQGIMDDIEGG